MEKEKTAWDWRDPFPGVLFHKDQNKNAGHLRHYRKYLFGETTCLWKNMSLNENIAQRINSGEKKWIPYRHYGIYWG